MPNFHLRRLRELRGWSLQRVADEIQSRWPDAALTGKEVGRWERGVRTPGPYYREKLCIIFETDAAHLGLIAASTKEDEKTEIDFPPSQSRFVEGKDQQIIQLTHEDLTILSEILHSGDTLMDEAKRNTLITLLKLIGTGVSASLILTNGELTEILPAKATENHLDLDVIGGYTDALQALLMRGEGHYVMHTSQHLYHKLLQEYPHSTDIRLAEVQIRLGMLIGAAQEYALPWYQRDQAVMQTYNHIEQNIFRKFETSGSLQIEYTRLLAKRGRQHRVLWQFEECIKECEDGLVFLREGDDFSLRTHLLCERAHIEATRGDELLWMRKLEEARTGALDMNPPDREKALNQVDYMQGEGYKRFAFHTQKDLPIAVREGYAKLALNQFTQWQGTTIELPGFETLVVQVSKAQCMILIDPSEAIDLAGELGRQVEKRYPALLDKIHRVIFLAQRRLQMSDREFLQIFEEEAAYHTGRNIL